jgi:hypothetical protein
VFSGKTLGLDQAGVRVPSHYSGASCGATLPVVSVLGRMRRPSLCTLQIRHEGHYHSGTNDWWTFLPFNHHVLLDRRGGHRQA